MKPKDISKAKEILTNRMHKRLIDDKTEKEIEILLIEAVISEEKRLTTVKKAINRKSDMKYWKDIRSKIYDVSFEEKKQIMRNIIDKYFEEIAGKFNNKVYNFVYKIMKFILRYVYSEKSLFGALNPFSRKKGKNCVVITGESEWVKSLCDKGTLVIVPTHSSNFDSIVIGTALRDIGLPPVLYGAGINLYTNPILAFFMRRLGGYTVDREKGHSIYKDILKEFATITMEIGYHNTFFPNGTRSRSNVVDNHLKLGLIGSAFNSYINNLKNKNEKPNLYIVPITINYHICFEAGTLIEQHLSITLKDTLIEKKHHRPDKITTFLTKRLKSNLKVYFNIAPPLDIFGNKVDRDGNSLDTSGNFIDPKTYLFDNSENYISSDEKNMLYIKNIGDSIVGSYYQANVVLSTHILAFAIFELAKNKVNNNTENLYKLLRSIEESKTEIEIKAIKDFIEQLLVKINHLAEQDKISLSEEINSKSAEDIIKRAIEIFSVYEKNKMLTLTKESIIINDARLLLYYRNRLEGYGFSE